MTGGCKSVGSWHVPTRIDDGVDPAEISREWIEQVINSNVAPRVQGVRVYPVPLSDEQPARQIYVVEIPKATSLGPHQAADKCYYKRFNFEARKMEDYEVKDTFGRASSPDLSIELLLDGGASSHVTPSEDPARHLDLTASLVKASIEPAPFAVVRLYLDARLGVGLSVNGEVAVGEISDAKGERHRIKTLSYYYGQSERIPSFQDVKFLLFDGPVQVQIPVVGTPAQFSDYYLGWEVNAPRMAKRSAHGAIRLSATTAVTLEGFGE